MVVGGCHNKTRKKKKDVKKTLKKHSFFLLIHLERTKTKNMVRVIVLGGGMVGGVIAVDLALVGHDVTVADLNPALEEALVPKGVKFTTLDASNIAKLKDTIAPFDIVVCAVPGPIGFETVKTCIESQKNVVDISFAPEDTRDLDDLAKENGVTVVYDAGIAPGMSNLHTGHAVHVFDELVESLCYVGGLPQENDGNWGYNAVFSIPDTVSEYTRPARILRDGKVTVVPAMSELETLEVRGLKLEAFLSDGCRSLLDLPVQNLVEKTMRYPGHIAKMEALKEAGKFSDEKLVETTKELAEAWRPKENFRDLLVMRVINRGVLKGKRVEEVLETLDKFDESRGETAMSRTTGFSCSAVAQIVANGIFSEKGVFPPEKLGFNDDAYAFWIAYYEKKGIVFDRKVTVLEE
jgi:lysine 6-dehydrogenase